MSFREEFPGKSLHQDLALAVERGSFDPPLFWQKTACYCQPEACQGKQGFVRGFHGRRSGWCNPDLLSGSPLRWRGEPGRTPGPGRTPAQPAGEFLVHQLLPFKGALCPGSHARCAPRALPSVSSMLPWLTAPWLLSCTQPS